GHRQFGNRARPQDFRQARLPLRGHHQVRHAQGRAPGRQGLALQDVGLAPRAVADGPNGWARVPDRQTEAVEKQRRFLRRDEYLILSPQTPGGGDPAALASLDYARGAASRPKNHPTLVVMAGLDPAISCRTRSFYQR